MIKNSLKRKILLILSCLLFILIIYLFPSADKKTTITSQMSDLKETIIYLKDNNDYLARVGVYINENNPEDKIKEIIKYLTINSDKSHYLKKGFQPIIPQKTKLLSISIDKSLVKLNFSKELLTIEEKDEKKLISAIVYSITGISGIDSVSIYVDDNLLSRLPNSNEYIPSTITRNYGINQIYNITNLNGINKTTIYYLAKSNNYYYYIPVTVIDNNQKEKMEIIINELTSKASYQTGLISYLKASKDITYNYNDNIMELSLSKNLFNSLNTANILESTIYSINLSIKENYNIEKVIYLIDTQIYKVLEI